MNESLLMTSQAGARAREDNLVAAARAGDEEAFGELFEAHKDAVFAFVRRMGWSREDADDIVQDCFVRAWRSLGRFRGESKLSTWLCRIALNLCADRARSSGRSPDAQPVRTNDEFRASQAPLTEDRTVLRQALEEALARLPVTHRALVVLCEVMGFSNHEAAEMIGCSAVSARVRLCRARQRLRALLAPVLHGGE